jgi:sigma-E factor negative regulatory protein RseB
MMKSRKKISRALALAVGLVALNVSAQDVRGWLNRMGAAVEELNYEGTFVHVRGDNTETLHIIHRNDSGRVSERMVSLDDVGREIIRQDHEIQCILPDRKVVLLEQTRDISPLVSALPSYSEGLESHYDFAVIKTARVARRATQVIGIRPKDEFRYGYILWLDEETAMPLKTQLRDENGEIVEQILFTQFDIVEAIPGSVFESTIDTEGFTWFHPPQANVLHNSSVSWRAASLPSGFKLSVAKQSPIAGSKYPVEHLVYSDGLATVSVFIEDPKTDAEVSEGFTKVGSTNAYSLTLNGRKVTAIGEVPRETVRTIAASLTAE